MNDSNHNQRLLDIMMELYFREELTSQLVLEGRSATTVVLSIHNQFVLTIYDVVLSGLPLKMTNVQTLSGCYCKDENLYCQLNNQPQTFIMILTSNSTKGPNPHIYFPILSLTCTPLLPILPLLSLICATICSFVTVRPI